ncbi:hypothetical protein B0H34DRAFT_808135 [Crassisporium funariophilum]|nr:hypothetical protein B0H34DRAFT_808135 [Crassisporium funariophilum]
MFNHADQDESVPRMMGPIIGKVYVYLSSDNLAHFKFEGAKTNVTAMIGPLLQKMGTLYVPVASPYSSAIVDDEDVEWEKKNGKYRLTFLISDCSVQFAYCKWKACLEAQQAYNLMWLGQFKTDLIQLFVGKSYWYFHYQKQFRRLANYPDMTKWLAGDEDVPSILAVENTEESIQLQ